MFGIDIVPLAIGGLLTLTVLLLYFAFAGEDKSKGRVQAVHSRHEIMARQRAEAKRDERRKTMKKAADDINEHTKKQQDAREAKTIEARLDQAGLNWTKKKFFVFALILGGAGAGVPLVLGALPIIAVGSGFICLIGLPIWILQYLKKKRLKAFYNELPNALDVLVRGVKSGLPLNDSMRIVAREASEPLRSEFLRIVEEQQMGISISDATARLYQRIPLPEANFFGIVLAIQSKAGGNLSEALGNLSRVIRERKKMRGKVNAMSMEAKASAGIIGSLPLIVMLLVQLSNPEYLELLFVTLEGRFVLLASGLWMLIGVIVMKNMISFEI